MSILQSDSKFFESASSTITNLITQNKQYFATRVEDAKRIIYGLLLRLSQIQSQDRKVLLFAFAPLL